MNKLFLILVSLPLALEKVLPLIEQHTAGFLMAVVGFVAIVQAHKDRR